MNGANGEAAAILTAIEIQALHTYCYCHALNLAIADTIMQSKVCCDAFDTAFDITMLIVIGF